MAVHRGRIGLLEELIQRDSVLLQRRLAEAEIFPAEIGMQVGEGLHCAPLDGATWLHISVEHQDVEIVKWLIAHGTDVNTRSAIDPEGFGGHTPLFHKTVTLGHQEDTLPDWCCSTKPIQTCVRPSVSRCGWAPNRIRCVNATAIAFARKFQQLDWVTESAITVIQEQEGE